jgi:hypothetical protein
MSNCWVILSEMKATSYHNQIEIISKPLILIKNAQILGKNNYVMDMILFSLDIRAKLRKTVILSKSEESPRYFPFDVIIFR